MGNEIHAHGGLRYARAAAVAAAQWGNITRRQLRDVGFSSREIDGMVARGLLHRQHHGVFALGAPSRAPEAKWAAALLAAGDGAALSHTSAAAFHGLVAVRAVTQVTAPTRRRGDDTLKVRTAKRHEARWSRGLLVATVPQTLLDLAAIGWPIDRLTHEAAAASLVSLDDLRAFALDRRGEPGAPALKRALGLPHTRSQWERDFLAWLKTLTDIPPAIFNDPIGHLTVDCHWPEHDFVVELDTEQTHGTPWAERRDAERDDWLRDCRGKTVLRIRKETFDREATHERLRDGLDPRLRAGVQSP